MNERKDKYERPEAYPHPSETDRQLQNQPEFIDEEPNKFNTDTSNIPVHNPIQNPPNQPRTQPNTPSTTQP